MTVKTFQDPEKRQKYRSVKLKFLRSFDKHNRGEHATYSVDSPKVEEALNPHEGKWVDIDNQKVALGPAAVVVEYSNVAPGVGVGVPWKRPK